MRHPLAFPDWKPSAARKVFMANKVAPGQSFIQVRKISCFFTTLNPVQFSGGYRPYRPMYCMASRFWISEPSAFWLIGATTKCSSDRSVTMYRSARRTFLKDLDFHRHLCHKIKSRFMHLFIGVCKNSASWPFRMNRNFRLHRKNRKVNDSKIVHTIVASRFLSLRNFSRPNHLSSVRRSV
jgi:hypothetical protein